MGRRNVKRVEEDGKLEGGEKHWRSIYFVVPQRNAFGSVKFGGKKSW